MKLTYTGKAQDLTKEQQKKLDVRFARIGKLVEKNGGERKAHVVLKSTRHLIQADISMQFSGYPVNAAGSATDTFQALYEAGDKLEKQLLKVLEKTRAGRRDNGAKKLKENGAAGDLAAVAAVASEDEAATVRVYKVRNARQKPMTLEEAMLQIGDKKDYLVYRDADGAEAVSILIRRRDGHFDLVQS
jgi:ribosomal subunit interface protein